MSKYVVIFVEGETEEELYKNYIIPLIRNELPNKKLECEVSIFNVRGVGGFKNDSIMKFKRLIEKNPNKEFIVALCYDTDIFEFASVPPIDWNKVQSKMEKEGANKVIQVRARKSIEDWLLYDVEGICRWLRIQVPSKVTGKNGYDKIKTLFKKGNKIYIKGRKVSGLLERLDINKILEKANAELEPLISILKSK